MNPPKARTHVKIRTEAHSTGGKRYRYHILTWYPTPGNRCRKTFTSLEKAEQEADHIEKMLVDGHADISQVDKRELAAFIALWKILPAHVTPATLVQFWLNHSSLEEAATRTTSVEVVAAFLKSRSSTDSFSTRHIQTVRHHLSRFSTFFGSSSFQNIDHVQIKKYLDTEVGGAAKTRFGHLITIRSLFRWARDTGTGKDKFLPPGRTAAEEVQTPRVDRCEHQVYSPDEFSRLLVFTPPDMVMFMVLGQFAGIRALERTRLLWSHWRDQEDGKLVLNADITKTGKRRRVDVPDNLSRWMSRFRGRPEDKMVPLASPHTHTGRIAKDAGVPWKDNALRAGFASYHLEMFDNLELTAKNDGHSAAELERTYKSISGVTKQTAAEMFSITPESVIEFAHHQNIPTPLWTKKQ